MKILPDPQKQGEIHFLIAKKWAYKKRMIAVALLMAGGLFLQLFIHFWIGLLPIIAATALSMIKGYSAKPSLKAKAEKWNQVTPDEFEKVLRKQKQLSKWDIDFFDITNALGCFFFVLLAGICFGVMIYLEDAFGQNAAFYWAVDAVIVFLPHWLSGVKTYLKKDRLIIKIKLLKRMIKGLSAPSDIQVLPMLSTRETREGGTVPMDARLMLKFLNAPEFFLGMQIQISMNNVQGKDYPYLYCVLIAKQEAKFFRKNKDRIKSPTRKVIIENSQSEDVDVLVVRQRTSRTSGYHTNISAATTVVYTALNLARDLLKS